MDRIALAAELRRLAGWVESLSDVEALALDAVTLVAAKQKKSKKIAATKPLKALPISDEERIASTVSAIENLQSRAESESLFQPVRSYTVKNVDEIARRLGMAKLTGTKDQKIRNIIEFRMSRRNFGTLTAPST